MDIGPAELIIKIFFSTTLALIVALMMSGIALAASGSTTACQVNRVGMVTATGSHSLTIQTTGGKLFTVKVGSPTQYQMDREGNLYACGVSAYWPNL